MLDSISISSPFYLMMEVVSSFWNIVILYHLHGGWSLKEQFNTILLA
jgi:DNA-binding HxlR family transcriptional regulator